MAVSREFLDHVQDALTSLGAVRVRRMFGGAGLYWQDVFFAILSEETLYFRVDEKTEPDYIAAGCDPFIYQQRGKTVKLPYYAVPEALFDEPESMEAWARDAIAAALRVKKKES
ncbi:MAG: hypothetical protein DCC73_09285 [Proteobacteria bacterium]|nr:MAG: hypothetical protein DCC73_09285 [Pseudomonadota bacterium]